MNDVMIDLETLDTRADGMILSIGACKFDLDSDALDDGGFYASVSLDSNTAAGRTISEDTLLWWMDQPAEARAVFKEPKQSLESALIEFADWFSSGPNKGLRIWSNGASFDVPMMNHAFKTHGMEVPWNFWDERCVRTYKNLPGMKNIAFVSSGIKHNAMHDAINQVRQVQAIQKELNNRPHSMVKPK